MIKVVIPWFWIKNKQTVLISISHICDVWNQISIPIKFKNIMYIWLKNRMREWIALENDAIHILMRATCEIQC